MRLAFILGGIAILWLLPGLAAAAVCLASRRLRSRAVQLSRHALRHTVEQYAAKQRIAPEAVWERYRISNSQLAHLVGISCVLVASGPIAVGRLRELASASAEIRLE